MSPSEAELRAALRDREGDETPDVDALIAHVRDRRAQRRVRLVSAAAAVVLVAGAAVGSAELFGGTAGGGSQHADAHRLRSGPVPVTSAPTAAAPTCPTSAPRAGGLSIGRSATAPDSAMFTAPVQTLVVCSYTDTATAARVTLTGTAATSVADSIENASTTRQRIVCPDITTGNTTVLALVPVTADGTVLPTVSTDISIPDCNQPITNGTAVRYNWRPPASLTAQLATQR